MISKSSHTTGLSKFKKTEFRAFKKVIQVHLAHCEQALSFCNLVALPLHECCFLLLKNLKSSYDLSNDQFPYFTSFILKLGMFCFIKYPKVVFFCKSLIQQSTKFHTANVFSSICIDHTQKLRNRDPRE